jgi:hypothetical protein
MSSRPTFSEAFGENFGDFGMIKQRYYAWIDKQRDLPSDH